MKFGLALPSFDAIASRDSITRAAQLAEQGGWDSVWVTDHVLMAPNQRKEYEHIFEAMTTLAYLAGITRRVKLGTSILVLPARNAVMTAKEIASLDQLSNGRFVLGIAVGWNEKEFGFLNADFHRRGRICDEQIAVMRALWTQPSPAFEGKFYRFSGTVFSPKPIQTNIPIWIGGNSEAGIRRAARLGDGWHMTGSAPEVVKQYWDKLRPLVGDRPFTLSARLEVTLDGKLPLDFKGPDGSARKRLGPTTADMKRVIEEYQKIGVEYIVLVLRDEEWSLMERHLQEIARAVLPSFN